MLLNAYLICLRCTRGSTIKRTVQLGGEAPNGKIHFPLITKGERFIRCRGQRHCSRGSMSDITSVLHDMISVLHHSVVINDKGGYFLLRLVFIDGNHWRVILYIDVNP
jgi:hypothetical protein